MAVVPHDLVNLGMGLWLPAHELHKNAHDVAEV